MGTCLEFDKRVLEVFSVLHELRGVFVFRQEPPDKAFLAHVVHSFPDYLQLPASQ